MNSSTRAPSTQAASTRTGAASGSLAHGNPDFQAACETKGVSFADQADVLVNTRLAADVMGATPMDRPEWTVVHPDTGEVFCTLKNNSERGDQVPVDAANPGEANANALGHIIRWREEDGRHGRRTRSRETSAGSSWDAGARR